MRIFVLIAFAAMAASGQPSDVEQMDRALTRMLAGGPYEESVPPLIYILIHANDAPSLQLFIASTKAMLNDRNEDAVFLYHAAAMRWRFDRVRFPLKGGEDESAYGRVESFTEMLEGSANAFMLRLAPAARANVLKRLEAWTPATPAGYKPGWQYLIVSGEEAARQHAADKKASLTKLRDEMAAIEKKKARKRR